MKPNTILPGVYRFDAPFEYVPTARVEAILREFRRCADENAQLQKELAKTQKELAAHRRLAARAG